MIIFYKIIKFTIFFIIFFTNKKIDNDFLQIIIYNKIYKYFLK